jgi:hypothetical protein
VLLERGEQERTELPLELVNARERSLLQQMKEKPLCQVLGIIRGVPSAAGEHVQRIPISAAQLSKRGLASRRLALRRPHDDRPVRGVKTRRAFRWQTMVAFHKEFRVSPTITAEITFRNKIS